MATTKKHLSPRIFPLGEAALLIEWPFSADEPFEQVHRAAGHVLRSSIDGLSDVVPGVDSLTIHFDPWRTDFDKVRSAVLSLLRKKANAPRRIARIVEIPVCYERSGALDADRVAQHCGMSFADIVTKHLAGRYTVQMIGFAPGFCYLSGLDSSLHVPRLPSPRHRVPAGSVGIGNDLTGIYPTELPGGWNIIGQTPARLFDPAQDPPTLLSPGDQVTFSRISARELEARRGS